MSKVSESTGILRVLSFLLRNLILHTANPQFAQVRKQNASCKGMVWDMLSIRVYPLGSLNQALDLSKGV